MDKKKSPKVQAAIDYATEMHKGQKRKGGKDYITHPIGTAEILMSLGYPENYIIAALFHDLLEDTDATESKIAELGGEDVLETVKLLTKKKGVPTGEYLAAIRKNPMAHAVKSADRLHNVRSLKEADDAFRKKYIEETEKYYIDFAINEIDLVKALDEIKRLPPAK